MHGGRTFSLEQGSSPRATFYICVLAKDLGKESLVCFDHLLDMVGHGQHLVVDFAHVSRPLMLAMTLHMWANLTNNY